MCWYCDVEGRRTDFVNEYWAMRLGIAATHLRSTDGFGIGATAIPVDGVGDLKPPILGDALIVTPDEAGDSIGASPGNPVIVVDAAPGVATTNVPGDQDFFQVTLEAGKFYEIGQYALVGGPNGVPQADAYIEIYDAAGNLIVSADGGGPNTPSGLDALLTFEAPTTGTYYVNFRAFDQDPTNGTTGDTVGDYTYFVREAIDAYRPYYDVNSPLYALDWGSQVNKIHQSVRNPDGNEGPRDTGNAAGTPPVNEFGITGKNVITVYFAKAGELYVDSDPTTPGSTDTIIAKGMEAFEIAAFNAVFAQFEKVADVVFVVVDNVYDPLTQSAAADFTLITYPGTPGTGLLGRMSPPDEDSEGQAEFNALGPGWNEQNLVPGGFSFVTLAHELGHGMGLSHPHDNGGRSGIMRGVEAEGVAFDYTTGDFDLNQGVFTMMSYEDGWVNSPYGNASTTAGYGYLAGPMAFDIAVLQDKYGVNEDTATGNDVYVMKDVNAQGTYYEAIWDAGGTDEIRYDGARDTTIDLRAATLQYEEGGGGRVSYAYGIFGGFTIANGVVIENATSGSGNDRLVGNAADNILNGGDGNNTFDLSAGGSDSAIGGTGLDVFYFGAALTADDVVTGGGGTQDQLALHGDYDLTFGAGNLGGVSTLVLLSSQSDQFGGGSGSASILYGYNLTTVDDNVAAGATLTVNYNGLQAGENVVFDGSAETDGGFLVYAGLGTDTLTGGSGLDIFYFGSNGNFTAADRVDGGGGAADQLGLRGDYTLVMNADSMTNVETLVLMSAYDGRFGRVGGDFDYDVTSHDRNVGDGQRMTVNGNNLRVDEVMRFDGSSETDGSFRLIGGAADDILIGSANADEIVGGLGADRLIGGGGADTYRYTRAEQSTGTGYDTIVGFDYSSDLIDLPGNFAGFSATVSQGQLSSGSFNQDLAAALNGLLGAGQAALFTPTSGDLAGKIFAVADANGVAGYQEGDYVFLLEDPVQAQLPSNGFFV